MGDQYTVVNINDARSTLRMRAAVNIAAQDLGVDGETAGAIATAVSKLLVEEGLVIVRRVGWRLGNLADD